MRRRHLSIEPRSHMMDIFLVFYATELRGLETNRGSWPETL
jgi:hypothetical protein